MPETVQVINKNTQLVAKSVWATGVFTFYGNSQIAIDVNTKPSDRVDTFY